MKPTLLVMAAGMGSRYGGLKQLDAVGPGGETLIEYSVYDAIRAGFGKVIFVIRPDIEAVFKETIGKRVEKKIAADYVCQEVDRLPHPFTALSTRTKPWGTGHAILVAEKAIGGPFAVINADNFYGASSFHSLGDYLRTSHDPDSSDYAMVGFVLRDTLSDHGSVSRAVCRLDAQGFLRSVTELAKIARQGDRVQYCDEMDVAYPLSGDEIVSRNMWGFTPSIFRHLRGEFVNFLEARGRERTSEFLLPTIVNRLVAKGLARVKVLPSQERGFGVTYREDLPGASRSVDDLIACGVYPKSLWG
jgi:hypothetical protein